MASGAFLLSEKRKLRVYGKTRIAKDSKQMEVFRKLKITKTKWIHVIHVLKANIFSKLVSICGLTSTYFQYLLRITPSVMFLERRGNIAPCHYFRLFLVTWNYGTLASCLVYQ